ncbi:hypothetical protein [Candidatus Parabeggiatoa sp. HSG14]|uniref:hypothetical protein n=1 Tax=Candidatus Parabeggiatoa sp. HSG14 TaxID=3055593 RepID=UPI0025A9154E|nr:hypothetical protein [Thiotrichales bacterium HSG14]
MTLKKSTLLGAMLLLSTELLAVPILQNQGDRTMLSNPDADETPILIDDAMTDKRATLYYPWNAIKILADKGNRIPKLSFTASSKGVLFTMTVSLDVHWQQLKEAVDNFKAAYPDIQRIQLKPLHPKIGGYIFALRLPNGERQYFPKNKVENVMPTNQVVINFGLVGDNASDFIETLMNGAVMEIHYQYQFTALSESQKIPVQVHSKLELNGYCNTFPTLFNHQLTRGQFEQGCLPNMEITDIPETLNREQICEMLPEMCQPIATMTKPKKSVADELAEYCQIFPDDVQCGKPQKANFETMKEICKTEPNTPKCAMLKKIEQAFVPCFFDDDCHTFDISIAEY